MQYLRVVICVIGLSPLCVAGQDSKDIEYISSADNTKQHAMFHVPNFERAVPLVVALHSWSGDYKQKTHQAIERWCVEKGWAYIHPDFRGPNRRPEATGSALVVKDIVSAVEHAQQTIAIDPAAIYLVGTSGGGYTALVMAGQHPEIWASVSAWVPISDLKAWYHQSGRYRPDIVKSCGGAPGDSAAVDEEYRKRSPLTYLARAKGLRLHIHTGIRDGHQGSVPISHSLRAFNEVCQAGDQISETDIRFFTERAQVPPGLKEPIAAEPSYGKKQPLFRRTSGSATVTVFNGGHELIATAAIAWLQTVHAENQAAAGSR